MFPTIDKEVVFNCEFTVSMDDTDQSGHVNNVVYIQWMQDIAIKHSEASGGTAAMQNVACTWVVRSHKVEYLSPAFAGDLIEASTWVENFRRVRVLRRYRFLRKSDDKILARGETWWVCVDTEKRKPCTIPEKVRMCFPATG